MVERAVAPEHWVQSWEAALSAAWHDLHSGIQALAALGSQWAVEVGTEATPASIQLLVRTGLGMHRSLSLIHI